MTEAKSQLSQSSKYGKFLDLPQHTCILEFTATENDKKCEISKLSRNNSIGNAC